MIILDGSSLTIEQLLAVADRAEPVALASVARQRVNASRAVVERRARGDEPAYGINTGFGSFAEVKIPPDALDALQLNLLRSHAAGLGDPLPARTVRATMALRANVLAKGFSGISIETLEALPSAMPDVQALVNPQGTPVEEWKGIPVMSQATAGEESKDGESYSFKVDATVKEAQDFYSAELVKLGWSSTFSMPGNETASILAFQKDSNLLTVTIMNVNGSVVAILTMA